ncbi:RHS repeat-associated core domain-containing protein, partial [Flavobacterium jumunjinense]
NQLVKVDDSSNSPQGFKDGTNTDNDFFYDANGNMTKDNNKGITNIQYNHLNLPTKIVVGTNRIEYIYNATGQKVSKIVIENTTTTNTNYLAGGFQYKNNVLQFFPQAEGYVKNTAGAYSYVFNYTDHLGNVRVSYSDIDGNDSIQADEILEESHYYPFGLKHEGYNSNNQQPNYNYKYNGQEWQSELGLNV